MTCAVGTSSFLNGCGGGGGSEPYVSTLPIHQFEEEVAGKTMELGNWKTDERTQRKLTKLTEYLLSEVEITSQTTVGSTSDRMKRILGTLAERLGNERAQEISVWILAQLSGLPKVLSKIAAIKEEIPVTTSTIVSAAST